MTATSRLVGLHTTGSSVDQCPQLLDNGHLNFVQSFEDEAEERETRTVSCPPSAQAWRGAPVGLGLGVVVVGVDGHEDQERWVRLERKKRRGRGRAKVRVWLGGRMVSPCG
jgi:hypothetical protein